MKYIKPINNINQNPNFLINPNYEGGGGFTVKLGDLEGVDTMNHQPLGWEVTSASLY